MGNKHGKHVDHAQKTGVLALTHKKLKKACSIDNALLCVILVQM